MKPRLVGPVLAIASLFLLPSAAPTARAQGGDLNLVPGTAFEYGMQARFTLSTDLPAQVDQAQLYFHRSESSQLIVRSGTAAQDGIAGHYEVVLDLQKEPLPPFSTIISWWIVKTRTGETAYSPKVAFTYFDNRKEWGGLTDPPFTVSWTGMQAESGEQVLGSLRRDLEAIETTLGLPSPSQLSVFLYPSVEALRDSLQIAGAGLTGSFATPAPGVLLIVAGDDLMSPAQLDQTLAAGLTEAVLYGATGERYTNVPSWFTDGLGALMVPGFEASIHPALQQAIDSNRIPELRILCSEGGDPGLNQDLRSEQAASVLQFILEKHGKEGVLRILSVYAEGAGCEKGVELGIGLSLDQLEMRWLASVDPREMLSRSIAQLSPWLFLLVPVILLVVFSFFPRQSGALFGRPRPQPGRLKARDGQGKES